MKVRDENFNHQPSSSKFDGISINVDTAELDVAIEKANRLVELLQEAQRIISSLGKTTIINNNCKPNL